MALVVAVTIGLIVTALDVVASRAIVRGNALSIMQKAAWLLLIWLAPILGATFALQVSSEPRSVDRMSNLPDSAGGCDSGIDVAHPNSISSYGDHGGDSSHGGH